MERVACGWGEVKRLRAVFPVAPIWPRSDTQYGISAVVYVIIVDIVVDVASGIR